MEKIMEDVTDHASVSGGKPGYEELPLTHPDDPMIEQDPRSHLESYDMGNPMPKVE